MATSCGQDAENQRQKENLASSKATHFTQRNKDLDEDQLVIRIKLRRIKIGKEWIDIFEVLKEECYKLRTGILCQYLVKSSSSLQANIYLYK